MKFILFFSSFFLFPFIAHANVAPLRIPGQTLIPLGLTPASVSSTETKDIVMSSEEVILDVHLLDEQVEQFSTKTDAYIRARSRAFVTASFILENSNESEYTNFTMGFPFGTGGLRNVEGKLETDDFAQLQNLKVFVDDLPIEYQTVSRQADEEYAEPTEPWAVWTANFGKHGSETARREVKVTYDILSSDMYFVGLDLTKNADEDPYNTALFYYILHTGKGWKGPIGKTIVRIKVPKEIELVQQEFKTWVGGENTPSWKISPKTFTIDEQSHEIVWGFTNWEPELPSDPYADLWSDEAGSDILFEFMYPETVEAFEKNFPVTLIAPLSSLATTVIEQSDIQKDVETNSSLAQTAPLSFTWILGGAAVLFLILASIFMSSQKNKT